MASRPTTRLPGCATSWRAGAPSSPRAGPQRRPQLGIAHGKAGPGTHSGQEELTEAARRRAPRGMPRRSTQPPGRSRPGPRRPGPGTGCVAPAGRHTHRPWPARGPLGRRHGVVIVAHTARNGWTARPDLSQPTRVVEGLGEGLGLAQSGQGPLQSPERQEASAGRGGDQWPARACRACSGRCARA